MRSSLPPQRFDRTLPRMSTLFTPRTPVIRTPRSHLKLTAGASKYNWTLNNKTVSPSKADRLVKELSVSQIRRPLQGTRSNDQEKVSALMESISEIGLQEPIDVLEVDGQYYGFSGCHRFEAHQRLGLETIKCRVRKATKSVLKMHLM